MNALKFYAIHAPGEKNDLAIDQGPVVVMIENYRSGLLWDLFMSASEIKNGLFTLNFKTDKN
jgi:hypothetical protein